MVQPHINLKSPCIQHSPPYTIRSKPLTPNSLPPKSISVARNIYWRVAIQDRNGNQGPFTDAMIIIDRPITGLTATNDSPTELGNITTLTATIESGTNVTYEWDYGDGNFGSGATTTHVYPDVGSFTAIVTATNTIGSVMATTMLSIVDVPIIGLTATNDGPTEFGSLTTLTATIDTGTNVIYTWDFGDGTDGSGAVVTHTYTAPGSFNATVTATNGTNSSSALTVVNILDEPISGLSAQNDSPTYLGDSTILTATIEFGTNVTYVWNYGDGSFGSGAISSHIYPDLGNFTAIVTATNIFNSMATSTIVAIVEEPITGLTATNDSPTFLGGITHFIATIATGTSVTYSWDFGDGINGSGATPSHMYDDLGDYTAVVTATNSVSSGTANTLVTIVEVPISGLAATNDSPTELGSLTILTATITGGTHVSYAWDFGDDTTGNGAIETHTYHSVGIYTTIVTATNSINTASATTMVTIIDVPITGLVAKNDSPTYLGDTTTLSATIVAGTGVTYAWNFGDGTNGIGQVTTHAYTALGVYAATVTATNSQGDVQATTEVTIIPPLTVVHYVFMPLTLK